MEKSIYKYYGIKEENVELLFLGAKVLNKIDCLSACIEFIRHHLTTENSVPFLIFSCRHNCTRLIHEIVQYILKNIQSVGEREEFLKLSPEIIRFVTPVIFSLMHSHDKENIYSLTDFLSGMQKWAFQDTARRESTFKDFQRILQFSVSDKENFTSNNVAPMDHQDSPDQACNTGAESDSTPVCSEELKTADHEVPERRDDPGQAIQRRESMCSVETELAPSPQSEDHHESNSPPAVNNFSVLPSTTTTVAIPMDLMSPVISSRGEHWTWPEEYIEKENPERDKPEIHNDVPTCGINLVVKRENQSKRSAETTNIQSFEVPRKKVPSVMKVSENRFHPPGPCVFVISNSKGRSELCSVNIKTQDITSIAEFPFPEDLITMFYARRKIFAICTSKSNVNGRTIMRFFHTGLHSWIDGPSMMNPRSYFGAGQLHHSIYVFGGVTSGRGSIDTIERYSIPLHPANIGSWATVGQMTQPRVGHATVVNHGKFYCIGGWTPQNEQAYSFVSSLVEVYDPETNTWSSLAPMLMKRTLLSAVFLDSNLLLVIGGRTLFTDSLTGAQQLKISRSCEVYDLDLNKWTYVAPLNQARQLASTFVVDGSIYVLGGHNGPPTMEKYDITLDKWIPIQNFTLPAGGSNEFFCQTLAVKSSS